MASEQTGYISTEALFREHAGFVARFLTRLGVPEANLDDALQEVFLVVHRQGGYRPGLAKPTSYLGRLAIYAAAQYRRRESSQRARFSDAQLEHVVSDGGDPARAVQARQELQRLQRALDLLPERLRTTLLLVDVEGETSVSVAAAFGCPVGTVYWRLHQARKKLQAALQSVDVARRAPDRTPDDGMAPSAQGQPATARWSVMTLFFFDGFQRTEAARLLRLARSAPPPGAPIDTQLSQHHQLVQSSAPLPTWASAALPQTATWASVIGTGPIVVGLLSTGGALVLAVSMMQAPRTADAPEEAAGGVTASASAEEAAGGVTASASTPDEPDQVAIAGGVPPASPAAVPSGSAEDAAGAPAGGPAPSRAAPRPAAAVAGAVEEGVAHPPGSVASPVGDSPLRPTHRDGTDTMTAGLATGTRRVFGADGAPARSSTTARRAPARPAAVEASGGVTHEVPGDPPAPPADAELAEMREVARAERLLESDPERTLAMVHAMRASFPDGYFREERAYLEVMALAALGRDALVRSRATAFLSDHPAGLYSERVRRALAGAR